MLRCGRVVTWHAHGILGMCWKLLCCCYLPVELPKEPQPQQMVPNDLRTHAAAAPNHESRAQKRGRYGALLPARAAASSGRVMRPSSVNAFGHARTHLKASRTPPYTHLIRPVPDPNHEGNGRDQRVHEHLGLLIAPNEHKPGVQLPLLEGKNVAAVRAALPQNPN